MNRPLQPIHRARRERHNFSHAAVPSIAAIPGTEPRTFGAVLRSALNLRTPNGSRLTLQVVPRHTSHPETRIHTRFIPKRNSLRLIRDPPPASDGPAVPEQIAQRERFDP